MVGLKPGSYAVLRRTWHRGDTIKLTFPMRPRWVEHDHFEGGAAAWAPMRGPVVYALDTVWWDYLAVPAPRDVGQEVGLIRTGEGLRPCPSTSGQDPFYKTEVKVAGGQKAQATLVPFTNIGRWYRDGSSKPDRRSRTFSYAIWLRNDVTTRPQ